MSTHIEARYSAESAAKEAGWSSFWNGGMQATGARQRLAYCPECVKAQQNQRQPHL